MENRRDFLKQAAGLAAALAVTGRTAFGQDAPKESIRVGFIGVGGRGSGHVGDLLKIPKVQVKAVCDIVPSRVEAIQNRVEKAGQGRPEGYTRGERDYRRLCARNDLTPSISRRPGSGTSRCASRR